MPLEDINNWPYKNENYKITKIAELIGVNKSTISRELQRNSENNYYSAESAQIKASTRDRFKLRHNKLKLKIGRMLRESFAPKQLA